MRPVRVLLDMHAVGENLSGNEVYVKNLAKHLLQLEVDDCRFCLVFGRERDLVHFEDFSGSSRGADFEFELLRTNSSVKRLIWRFPRILAAGNFDVAHFQYVLPALLPKRTRRVIVVHDVSYKRFPHHFTKRQRVIHRAIDASTRRADTVLTVSEFSKLEILTHYRHLTEGRVTNTSNGVDPEVFRRCDAPEPVLDRLRQRIGTRLPHDFILTVGNLQPRKNLVRLIRAFDEVSAHRQDLALVIAGRRAWRYGNTLTEIGRRSDGRVVFTDYVTQDELIALYGACRLFVYPSIYEGFGLPVLEAISCGAVTLTSQGSALQEVCPVPEALFDPLRVDTIAERILACADDMDLRERIRASQAPLVPRFSWTDVAARTLAVYRDLASTPVD